MASAGRASSSLITQLSRMFATVAAIPFNYKSAPTNGQVDGPGRVFIVSVAQGTPTTITHNLGRTPILAQVVDNGATAQTLLQITARSATTITIVPLTAALTSAIVRIA